MRKYIVTVRYFDDTEDKIELETKIDDLSAIEGDIRRRIKSENDMMYVTSISYEMKPKLISLHKN